MRRVQQLKIKKAIFASVLLCVFIVAPSSLAEDLLAPILGTVDEPAESPTETPISTESAIPMDSPTPTPTTSPTTDSVPSFAPNGSGDPEVPHVASTESPTATASPTPLPPHAIANQSMRIAVPATISTDPRAHSVFLPRLQLSGVEILLLCGYANASAVQFTQSLPGVEVAGSGSQFFRLSGPANLVMATFNSDMGARVVSSRAIPGSTFVLRFVALSEPSINQALCNDGRASNTRTISFRALSMDLNMIKDSVRLK